MADMRPMDQRAPEFKQKLVELCKLYRIEVIATLTSNPSGIFAQIRFVDVNNPEELKKYGLTEIKEENTSSSLLTN